MLHASIFPSFVFLELSLVSETNMPCFERTQRPVCLACLETGHENLDAKISTKHSGCLGEGSNFRHPFLAKRSNMGHG